MADIPTAAPITVRRLNLPRLSLPRLGIGASLAAISGLVADAFNMAFIFPNLTRRLFGEGLLTSVFVPVFSDRLAKGQREAANRTASVLLIRLSYWLSIGCVVCIAASVSLVTPFEPSCILVYGPGKYQFLDFMKTGAILTVLIFVICMLVIPKYWPL